MAHISESLSSHDYALVATTAATAAAAARSQPSSSTSSSQGAEVRVAAAAAAGVVAAVYVEKAKEHARAGRQPVQHHVLISTNISTTRV